MCPSHSGIQVINTWICLSVNHLKTLDKNIAMIAVVYPWWTHAFALLSAQVVPIGGNVSTRRSLRLFITHVIQLLSVLGCDDQSKYATILLRRLVWLRHHQ